MNKIMHIAVVGLVLLVQFISSRKMYPGFTIWEDKKTGQYIMVLGPSASKINHVNLHPLPPWSGKEIVHLEVSGYPRFFKSIIPERMKSTIDFFPVIKQAMSFDSMLAYGKASINGKLVWVAEGGHDLCLLHLPCKHQCPFKEGEIISVNKSLPLSIIYIPPGIYKGYAEVKTLDSEGKEILLGGVSFAVRLGESVV